MLAKEKSSRGFLFALEQIDKEYSYLLPWVRFVLNVLLVLDKIGVI